LVLFPVYLLSAPKNTPQIIKIKLVKSEMNAGHIRALEIEVSLIAKNTKQKKITRKIMPIDEYLEKFVSVIIVKNEG